MSCHDLEIGDCQISHSLLYDCGAYWLLYYLDHVDCHVIHDPKVVLLSALSYHWTQSHTQTQTYLFDPYITLYIIFKNKSIW